MMPLSVQTFPIDPSASYTFVVIFSRCRGRWLFSRHRQRSTWETQGGHIEPGETPEEAARRELWEESGATAFALAPVRAYAVGDSPGGKGVVFFAEIETLGPLPESEMAEVQFFDDLPQALTYPEITPVLFRALPTGERPA